MKRSTVYFCDLRTSVKENLPAKLRRLLSTAGFDRVIPQRGLVAIKLHFGERGNTAFVRPVLVQPIVEEVKARGGLPFLTDSNTLYAGTRGNSVSHLRTAVENGFAYAVVEAPLIIADGLRGASFARVRIDQEMIETAYVGKEIAEADALVSVAHFKGHELSGFGGSLKNVGMGCASRKGKLEQHSDLAPKVKKKRCAACGACAEHCAQSAIRQEGEEKAVIQPERCVGCGECILICPEGAIDVQWDADVPRFHKKMAEYTLAVLKGKEDRAFFVNFITAVSPACDCYGHADAPIVADVGVVAGRDPVAVDQASVDLVNDQPGAPGTALAQGMGSGEDKFRALYPKVDWSVQLDHGEKIGLGTRRYELVRI